MNERAAKERSPDDAPIPLEMSLIWEDDDQAEMAEQYSRIRGGGRGAVHVLALPHRGLPPVRVVSPPPEEPPPPPPPAPVPEPEPEPIQPPAPEPKEESDDPMDLARTMVAEDPSALPIAIIARIRERWGKAGCANEVYELCRKVREEHGLPPIQRRIRGGAQRGAGVEDLIRDFVERLRATGQVFEDFTLGVNAEWEIEFTYAVRRQSHGKLKL